MKVPVPSILITGSNRGLGLGFATSFARKGWRVFAACRNLNDCLSLEALTKDYAVSLHPLDVTNPDSVKQLASAVSGPVDILLNNAAFQGSYPQKFGTTNFVEWRKILQTNVFGVMRMCEAFEKNVAGSEKRLIVNISSRTGSIERKTGADIGNYKGELHLYRSSKSALNMISRCLAWDLAKQSITVVALAPGWVRTDLGGPNATLSVEDAVSKCIAVIENLSTKDFGRFVGHDSSNVPW